MMTTLSRPPVLRRVVFLTVLAGVMALAPPLLFPRHVKADEPYYPYPCVFPTSSIDFDGNLTETPGPSWDPRTGIWDMGHAFLAEPGAGNTTWGAWDDLPTPGDYNDDGVSDPAVWRPSNGTWYVKCSSTTNCGGGTKAVAWGTAGDLPVPADYDNDGFSDYGVWRPTTGAWYVLSGADATTALVNGTPWGTYGDCPLPARVEALSGPKHLNVWRPSNGTYYAQRTLAGAGGFAYPFGAYGDIPFLPDADSNGNAVPVVWRPSTGVWYGLIPNFTVAWGAPGDIPLVRTGLPAGQGFVVAVIRPSTGLLYRCNSPLGTSCASTTTLGPAPGILGNVLLQGGSSPLAPVTLVDVTAGSTGTDNFAGQSAITPAGGPFNNLRFNWYRFGGTPTAFGTLYILSAEYLGLPGGLSASTPGFVARSESTVENQYRFARGVTLTGGAQYWFYTDTGGAFVNSFLGSTYAGGDLYVTGVSTLPFHKALSSPGVFLDANFRLQGAIVPAP